MHCAHPNALQLVQQSPELATKALIKNLYQTLLSWLTD